MVRNVKIPSLNFLDFIKLNHPYYRDLAPLEFKAH